MEPSNSSGFAIINSMIAIQDEDEEYIITRKNKEPENHFEDILCSSEKTHQEIWHDIEENEQLLELLWNQESITKPVMNEENNQLFIREDEMSRTLDCFDETTKATADFFCEFVEPSLRNISKDEVEKEENVRNLSEESLRAANIENASKVDKKRASVQCSVHGNCNSKKRKERVGKNIGFYNEDVDDIFGKTLQTSQPVPLRTRAVNIHNISEKKRRDRINEKMKTLQKLMPRCNKSNKASMLDDVIEYLKSLQQQVQMMSTTLQYNMGQMIFPNTQSYMGCMGDLGMCMGTGMNNPSVEMQRHMMPLGSLMPYPTMMLPQYASSNAVQLNPSFHMGAASIPSIPDARIEASNHHDQIANPVAMASSGMVQLPIISEPYRYCSGLHYHQAPTQSQVMVQPSQIFEDTENSRRQSSNTEKLC